MKSILGTWWKHKEKRKSGTASETYLPNHCLLLRRAGIVLIPAQDGYYDSEKCLQDFDRVRLLDV